MAQHHHYRGGPAATGFAKEAQGRHVMLATPSRKGDMCVQYVMSLAATIEALTRFGVKFDLHILDGDCHVDDARNKIFREFLGTPCTDLFFLDSDLGWDCRDLLKLLNAEGDIVAGIYRHKGEPETYPAHFGEDCPRTAREDGMFEMPKLPTGFMRIRREVIEALHACEVKQGRYFWDSPEDRATGKPPIAAICERAFASEKGWGTAVIGDKSDRHSGDLVLCMKARNLGFKCFADIEMVFDHVGDRAYRGSLGNQMRRAQNVDHWQFIAAVNALKAGDTSVAAFRKLNDHAYNGRAALPGEALSECWVLAKQSNGDVLEFGSGLSTLVLGLALAGSDKMVHAFENDLSWFKTTSALLERHGVTNAVLHYVPLVPYDGFDWYGVEGMDLPDFDMVLIDGPERASAARHGAFLVMPDVLAKATTWVIDDMEDPRQEAMLAKYGAGRIITRSNADSVGTEHFFAFARREAQSRVLEAAE